VAEATARDVDARPVQPREMPSETDDAAGEGGETQSEELIDGDGDGEGGPVPTAAAVPDAAPGEPAVEVIDLGIRYNLQLTRQTTLKGSLGGLLRRGDNAPRHFWALRHINFRVDHGESLGVIGPNGAGKSTLLLALAGILQPSEGEVRAAGRVSTLLTLGAGFEQELSGRDNIDLVAAFLGIDPKEMVTLTPSIIEFADIGPFIDAPVKTYSSGMRARLGFAIATAITPDILLLDEVLGTGDANFRSRSRARVHELLGHAKAIVLVTHDLSFVREFCNRALLIERGQLIDEGPPNDIINLYRQRVKDRKLLAEAEAQRFGKIPGGQS
jgi:ABC-2 type transport system ATP-binding protein